MELGAGKKNIVCSQNLLYMPLIVLKYVKHLYITSRVLGIERITFKRLAKFLMAIYGNFKGFRSGSLGEWKMQTCLQHGKLFLTFDRASNATDALFFTKTAE